MSLLPCIAKLNRELREFNTAEVKDAAKAYRARNLEEREANVKAVEDHLRDLTQQRQRVVEQVLDGWKTRDPEGYKAASRPSLELAGETEAEIKAREAHQAKQYEEERRKAAAPSPEGFTLTGSDRTVDEAEAHGQTAMFKRSEPRGGMTEEAARAALAPVIERTRIPIKVHRDIESLRQVRGLEGAPEDVKGVYHEGAVHAVASAHRDALDLQSTIARHELVHAGVDILYGGDRAARGEALHKLQTMNPDIRAWASAWRSQYGREFVESMVKDGTRPQEAEREMALRSMEEGVAHYAENSKPIRGWQEFVAVIQRGLRAAGFDHLADWLERASHAESQAAIAEIIRATQEAKPEGGTQMQPAFQRAFHGSPHDFDRFDTSKIGTGEGAQAYGHGLYFAGRKGVAEYYRESLTQNRQQFSLPYLRDAGIRKELEPFIKYVRSHAEVVATKMPEYLRRNMIGGPTVGEIFGTMAQMRFNWNWHSSVLYDLKRELRSIDKSTAADVNAALDRVIAEADKPQSRGRLYEVELAPKEDEYLDWDKGLTQQSESVKTALRAAGIAPEGRILDTGKDAYKALAHEAMGKNDEFAGRPEARASAILAKAGIPGIKYLDGSSRHPAAYVAQETARLEKLIASNREAVAKGGDAAAGAEGRIAEFQRQIDALNENNKAHHNYVIFDDKHVGVVAKYSRAGALAPGEEQAPENSRRFFAAAKEVTRAWVEDLQKAVTPMATGSDRARAVAKDFANAERVAREQWSEYDQKLRRDFTPEQLRKMWDAADEQNVLLQKGEETAGKGIDRLEPDERKAVEQMHGYANGLLAQAKELGMFQGEGLPYWTPRIVANIGKDGEFLSEPGVGNGARQPYASPTGKNITTTASSLKHREHLTTAETEAAAQAKFGEDAQVVRDIRTMPLAMARLERAIAGRQLIEAIREIGRKSGEEIVASGEKPGFFTVDSPAFKTYRPKFEDVDGKTVPVTDSAGNVVMDRTPIYVANEFEGPLKSIMSDKPGKIYSAFMTLKSKTIGLIMYSPLIHNAVEWGRALPLMPGKIITFRAYFEGHAARKDTALVREFVENGLVPIGKRFQNQDISGIIEEPTLKPGRSWTAQVLGGTTGLVNKAAGEAVKRSVDKAGDFYHNTLLWERVGDLQMGLAVNMRDDLMQRGMDRQTATRVASHLANRYAGALPNEAMSNMARKVANLSLFSRTFTIGNLGVMKDMLTGLPKDVQAQIRRDAGVVAAQAAVSIGRRKAIHAFMVDIALGYAMNSAAQSFAAYMRGQSLDDIEKGYVRRLNAAFDRVRENPLQLLNVFGTLRSLTPNSENEPGKENRVLFGYAQDGTAIYIRLPMGKIGEEFQDWITSPIDMLQRKESTLLRPTMQLLRNDKGFGREVYDKRANDISGITKNIGRIVANYMSQQLPTDSIVAAHDLMSARGDDDVNALKVLGPLFGVTFSKGAPGGPATGELLEVEKAHRSVVQRVLPEVRELIKDGKTGEALGLMTDNKFTEAEKRITLRFTTNPGTIGARSYQRFQQIATPEEIEAMRRMRQSSPPRE